MIKVDDLKQWANQNAIGRSPTCPHGYIKAKDLIALANEIFDAYPNNWEPVTNTVTSNKYTLPSPPTIYTTNPEWNKRYKEDQS